LFLHKLHFAVTNTRLKKRESDRFCRHHPMCPVESAEHLAIFTKAKNCAFHPPCHHFLAPLSPGRAKPNEFTAAAQIERPRWVRHTQHGERLSDIFRLAVLFIFDPDVMDVVRIGDIRSLRAQRDRGVLM